MRVFRSPRDLEAPEGEDTAVCNEPEVASPAPEPIGIAGAGKMAQALGRLLRERGEPVVAVASRDAERARAAAEFIGGGAKPASYSDLPVCARRVLVAVSDDAVTPVAEVLAAAGMDRGLALHTCGALGPEALAPLAARGVACGVLHPLQTVASAEEGRQVLHGVAFAIDGDAPAVAWAERIVKLLDGQTLRIPSDRRALYHAAAVMASNYIVGMIDAAVRLMGAARVDSDRALHAIGPLVRTSCENALRQGPAHALTGPIRRGDTGTVQTHLEALTQVPESVRELYQAAGRHVVEVARQGGLGEGDAQRLEELLRGTRPLNA